MVMNNFLHLDQGNIDKRTHYAVKFALIGG